MGKKKYAVCIAEYRSNCWRTKQRNYPENKMNLGEIINAIGPLKVDNFRDKSISQVFSDSREKFRDSIFIAVKGLSSDGALFAKDAVRSGAEAVVYETEIEDKNDNIVYIKVPNTRSIQSKIASMVYGNPSEKLKIAGVTGTNGKTSYAYIFRHILNHSGLRCAMLGTTEYDLGKRKFIPSRTTPDAVFLQRYFKEMVDCGVKYAVMEVSSHALALNRVDEVLFETAAFTNLSQDHLDFHKDMEDYAQTKSHLFSDHLKKGAAAALNRDDKYFDMMSKACASGYRTFSEKDGNADILIESVDYTGTGLSINYVFGGKRINIKTNLNGRFQAMNIAAAFLSANSMGCSVDEIVSSFEEPIHVPGRLEKIFSGEFSAFVDYAHSPDSLERTLKSIREFTNARIITVFGCGGNRDTEKRPVMGRIATELSDEVIITSDNPRNEDPAKIIADIRSGISKDNFAIEPDRKKAIACALEKAKSGDAVLIAGKGHEDYQEISGVKYPFSDAAEIKKILGI
jgi:UDP-N-acetylmuramoyl-L-alanyl-D-glutamate--2,6-diaminopimelate ligase